MKTKQCSICRAKFAPKNKNAETRQSCKECIKQFKTKTMKTKDLNKKELNYIINLINQDIQKHYNNNLCIKDGHHEQLFKKLITLTKNK